MSSLWTEEVEAKPEAQAGASSEIKKTRLVKDARDPAVVFFPTNADSECMDGSAGGGFNTFGFIAMMLATYNLVGLVSNNGNQNNNNQELNIITPSHLRPQSLIFLKKKLTREV